MSDMMSDTITDTIAPPRALTDTMVAYLKEASPWMRFMGILSFISCGLSVLGGLFMIFTAPFVADFLNSDDGEGSIIFGGLAYIFMGVILWFPARFIYAFGSRIRDYSLSGSPNDLELAFKKNKSLWKFSGILTIICLSLISLTLIIGILVTVLGTR